MSAQTNLEETDSAFNESLIKLQNLLNIFTTVDFQHFSETTATPTPSLNISPITGSRTYLVTELVNRIQQTCPQGVTYTNLDCLNGYPPPLDKAVPALVTSASLLRNLQCVGFIKGVEQMTHDTTWGVVGNAGGLLSYPPSNEYIPIMNTPENDTGPNALQAEDLVVYDYDTYGHIGYVISRNGDLFTTADANFYPSQPGSVTIRVDSIQNPRLTGWLRKQ